MTTYQTSWGFQCPRCWEWFPQGTQHQGCKGITDEMPLPTIEISLVRLVKAFERIAAALEIMNAK